MFDSAEDFKIHFLQSLKVWKLVIFGCTVSHRGAACQKGAKKCQKLSNKMATTKIFIVKFNQKVVKTIFENSNVWSGHFSATMVDGEMKEFKRASAGTRSLRISQIGSNNIDSKDLPIWRSLTLLWGAIQIIRDFLGRGIDKVSCDLIFLLINFDLHA